MFLDEAGNFDFSTNGTQYFLITSLTKERPFDAYKDLNDLKYDLAEQGICLEYFHASEDKQPVRDKVFAVITKHIRGIRIDSVVVEKCKTGPSLRPVERFYPKMMGYLVRYVLKGVDLSQYKEVLVFTDAIPLRRKKEAIQKAIKEVLADMLPTQAKYRIFLHDSKSNFDLQIVDYCNWALYRKYAHKDCRSHDLIAKSIESEFQIFETGHKKWY
jgi:hypothetical protein